MKRTSIKKLGCAISVQSAKREIETMSEDDNHDHHGEMDVETTPADFFDHLPTKQERIEVR